MSRLTKKFCALEFCNMYTKIIKGGHEEKPETKLNKGNRIEIYDEAHSTLDEERYITIGMAGEILFVVYTERGKRIRLISARLATARERAIYYDTL